MVGREEEEEEAEVCQSACLGWSVIAVVWDSSCLINWCCACMVWIGLDDRDRSGVTAAQLGPEEEAVKKAVMKEFAEVSKPVPLIGVCVCVHRECVPRRHHDVHPIPSRPPCRCGGGGVRLSLFVSLQVEMRKRNAEKHQQAYR